MNFKSLMFASLITGFAMVLLDLGPIPVTVIFFVSSFLGDFIFPKDEIDWDEEEMQQDVQELEEPEPINSNNKAND